MKTHSFVISLENWKSHFRALKVQNVLAEHAANGYGQLLYSNLLATSIIIVIEIPVYMYCLYFAER